jgi:hypothetical protein
VRDEITAAESDKRIVAVHEIRVIVSDFGGASSTQMRLPRSLYFRNGRRKPEDVPRGTGTSG